MNPYEVCFSLCNLIFFIANMLYQAPSSATLAQFLVQNEGKRCVVVLDVSAAQFVSCMFGPNLALLPGN